MALGLNSAELLAGALPNTLSSRRLWFSGEQVLRNSSSRPKPEADHLKQGEWLRAETRKIVASNQRKVASGAWHIKDVNHETINPDRISFYEIQYRIPTAFTRRSETD